MAAVGRLDPIKRWETAVEIVDSVRQLGYDLELTLIGHFERQHSNYFARLRSLAASRPWFRLLCDLDRPALLRELASHRYGIHTMLNEHFGIAPAELQRAGCIPFVHNSGGPVEIVGHDPRLTFDDVPDAVVKISRVLDDSNLQRELCRQVATRRELFTAGRFCNSMREVVAKFAQDPNWDPV
jgi:glycosyltransferase involved in cell wall biosynthesis